MLAIGPIAPEKRINSLDALRGLALLGILPANVLIFGMHLAAGSNPTVAGGATGLNLATWALVQILVVGKMRCLFSMVFGASMILLTSRAEERSGAAAAADIYYRRNLWLMLSARSLIIIGCLFIAFKTGWSTVDAFEQLGLRDLALAAEAAGKAGKKPTEQQAEAPKAVPRRAGEGCTNVARKTPAGDRSSGERASGVACDSVLRSGVLRHLEHDVHLLAVTYLWAQAADADPAPVRCAKGDRGGHLTPGIILTPPTPYKRILR